MQRQNAETAVMMASIADSKSICLILAFIFAHSIRIALRADMDRKHMETLESVRATAAEQIPFNVQRVSCLQRVIKQLVTYDVCAVPG
jgi:hypothetical protein